MLRRLSQLLSTAALLLLSAGAGFAQGWPTRPVTFIVPFAAGGGTDAFARPLAAQLDGQLGQRVIVENRAGAGGTAGAASAAKAQADGYTFFVGATHHAIAPAIYPRLSYNITTDFIPIGLISRPPHVVVINPQRLPVTSLSELVAHARANPDKLLYGHAGVGTTHHVAGELFNLLAGTRVRPVAYRGAGPALLDVVAGQIDMAFDGLGSSSGQIQGGYVKALAVTSLERNKAFPDIPTAGEAGLAGFNVSTWYGLWAVKGTPPAIVARMTSELRTALRSPAIQQSWEKSGSDVPDLTGAEFSAFLSSEITRWGDVARQAKVKIE